MWNLSYKIVAQSRNTELTVHRLVGRRPGRAPNGSGVWEGLAENGTDIRPNAFCWHALPAAAGAAPPPGVG
jgi:hypothetical protein